MRTLSLLLIALGLARCSALIFDVAAHAEECFFEDMLANNKLQGSFEVISGGFLDIDVQLFDPANDLHYTVVRQTTGQFNVMTSKDGPHRLCFSNKMSTLTPKRVAFSLHEGDDLFKEVATHEHITPLEAEMMTLVDNLNVVDDIQKYVWFRERTHRDTAESTCARILWFSVLESALIVALAVLQFVYLRKFFETKSVV